MEIRKLGNEQPLSKERHLDITRPTRQVLHEHTPQSIVEAQGKAATSQARQALPGRKGAAGDDLEISALQRVLEDPAVSAALAQSIEPARQAQVETLRQAYAEGQLNTPERIQRAAAGLLAKQ